nr:MBL fold metallo-hydrolase [Actinomycetota bacterium]
MILERAEHPQWTSNAYLLADEDGGHGVLVDSNGVEAPLLEQIAERDLTITHVLVTHHHMDHVVDVAGLAKRYDVPVVGSALTGEAGVRLDETFADGEILRAGGLEIQVLATPGHCLDHHALLVDDTDCLTADCLFKGTVGGTGGGGPNGYADQ